MQVRRIAAIAVALGVAFFPATASAGVNGTGWVIQSTVDPGGTSLFDDNMLEAVSCTSATSCTAVGTYYDHNSNMSVTLAEYWDGTSWQVQPTPSPATIQGYFNYVELRGVKCVSGTFCMAVGQYINPAGGGQTLAESWNGSSWSLVPSPNPAGAGVSQLNAVACTTTANCIAVGYYQNSSGTNLPLAEHWNGSTWALQSAPAITGGRLRAASCTSASACTAVGYHGGYAVAIRWNGTTWKTQSAPKPAGASSIQLNAVRCTSGTVCTAVGSGIYPAPPYSVEKTLAERWNGTAWTIQSTPNPNPSNATYPTDALWGISCTAANACTAAGASDDQTLAEYWNGSKWSVQPTPSVGETNELLGVSCVTATTCTAVGDHYTADSGAAPTLTLAIHRT